MRLSSSFDVSDRAGLGDDVGGRVLWQSVRSDLAVDARGQRHIDPHVTFVETRDQEKIAGSHAASFDLNPAIALAGRRHRRDETPRPRRIIRADADFNAAVRPLDAEVDVLECPVLAGALVVDCQVAVLEPELAQVMAVEPALADTVDP